MRWLLPAAIFGSLFGAELPAGMQLQLRLQQPITSFGSKPETGVSALVISPVQVQGETVIPLGAEVNGQVADVKRVGLGLSRETAYILFEFTSLKLPTGEQIPLASRVTEIDNSREKVDSDGKIHGIRATATLASVLSGAAVSLGAFDPMFLMFTFSSSLSAFRIPESEIAFPAGTEFRIVLTEPVSLSKSFPPVAPPLATDVASQSGLEDVIAKLPFRTATRSGNVPSDLTNLAFLGSQDAVQRAFDAAGWVRSDELNAQSTYSTMRSIVENQGYQQAPMSVLVLNGAVPQLTYSKTLDTFFKRHHLRIFAGSGQFQGRMVWTASATHDSGIAFATVGKTFIHVIDSNIDDERQKVVNDLVLTGCVDAVATVDRPYVPRDAKNATGDDLITDGAIAVVQLNACESPRRADTNVPAIEVPEKGNVLERAGRNVTLTLKNDVLRGNVFYQGYSGIRMGFDALKLKTSEGPKTVKYAGQEFKIVRGADAQTTPGVPRDHDTTPTFYPEVKKSLANRLELSFSGGYSRYPNSQFSSQRLEISVPLDSGTLVLPFDNDVVLRPGYSVSPRVTVNSEGYFSHEFSFTHNDMPFRVNMRLDGILDPLPIETAARTRQYAYNLLVHLRRNGSRVRPYIAIGPGFQVLMLTEGSADTKTKIRFAFRDAALIIANYRLGKLPPLEGGAIYQPTLSYGAGVKVHVTPRFLVRADFRETLSAQPDFWTKSYKSIEANFTPDPDSDFAFTIGPYSSYGALRQQVFSFGIGVSF